MPKDDLCPTCKGAGELTTPAEGATGSWDVTPCAACNGTGLVLEDDSEDDPYHDAPGDPNPPGEGP
jgi:DnaJ-class molecular chaperone